METNEVKETQSNWKVGDGTAGPGRPKGTPNKATGIVREAIANLLERNAPNMDRWLNEVADKDPHKALDIIQKLSEYHIPKLARTEVTGLDGAPQQHVVTWQK
jgi:hypothetical protein